MERFFFYLCIVNKNDDMEEFVIKIIPKVPPVVRCIDSWNSKTQGVVLVEKEEDIEPLWKLLCDQDDYWEHYKNLIKVAPKEIDSIVDIKLMCDWSGKTDIWDIPKLKESGIRFILYQYYEED